MQFERLTRLRPVREHHRDGRDGLHIHGKLRVIGDADFRIIGIRPDLAEELAILVDAMASVSVDHDRKTIIVILLGEIWPGLGQDMGVGVDLEHGAEFSAPVPTRDRTSREIQESAPAFRHFPNKASGLKAFP